MTRMQSIMVECPQCRTSFSATLYSSINTLMNPELLDIIFQNKFGVKCPSCGTIVHVNHEIIISSWKGIFTISTADPFEINRQKFLDHGLIDDQGNLLFFGFRLDKLIK
jgi:endogenous inhibitor of DNA gyrase (YacG/DUF329 family)